MTRKIHVAILALAPMIAVAQVNKSNLTGVVRDPSGGIVAGAEVRLVNLGTQVARTEPSNNDGIYRFLLVDLGTYQLEVVRLGFKKFSRSGILLNAGETTTTDVTLELGETTETVTVQGEASMLRTETGSNGTTVTQRAIGELPLQGRNPYVFLSLSAGIQYNGDPGNLNPWDNDGPSAFASSGSKIRSEFFLDGMPNEKLNLVAFSPSPDAVGEMRVQTNAYDAEYGHTGGAFINVSTKSGTNAYHGEGYNYTQNDRLNATPFFTNLNGQKKGVIRKNTFGGSLGGPVFVPKLFNGRNKTFFFVNYEGTRNPSASQTTIAVPTVLERTGDFSKTVDSAGRPITIYDPESTVVSGANAVRSVFAGNIIPANRWDPVGAGFAKNLYPAPNITPAPNTTNNFFIGRHNTFKWNSVSARVDEHLANHQLFFRFGWNFRTDGHDPYFPNNILGSSGADIFERNNIAGGIGDTWIKGSQTVVDFRLGFTRYYDRNYLYCEGMDLSTLGFAASFTRALQHDVCPAMTFTDTASVGSQAPNQAYVTQYQPSVNFHSIYGRHSLKYGVRYTDERQSIWSRQQPTFAFSRAFTQGPNPNQASGTAGFSTASLFLGVPATGTARITSDPANTVRYYAFYLQDDWKVSGHLTLNVGLRFEHETGVTDRFDKGISGLDTAVTSPLEAAAKANYVKSPIPELGALNVKGGIGFLAQNGAGRQNLVMPALMYAPRFGFAYRVTNRMVWRGGWGIFYGPNNMSNFNQLGFSLTTNMVTSLDGNLTPADKLASPFPAGLSQPLGSTAGLLTAVGQSLSGVTAAPIGSAPNFKDPLSQQFSTGFQFALPSGVSVETSFVANRSQRLTINGRNIDDIADSYLALGNRLNATVPNPFFGVITDSTGTLSRSTTTVRQLLQPYPQFTGVTVSALPFGRSNYNSLQVQVNRRLTQGVMVGVAYTFSKFMEATSYLNSNDAAPEHVISDADYPHHLVLSGLWELPFGPGKPLFASTNPIARRIAGGWQVSWIGTVQSGQALSFAGAERISDTNADEHSYTNWFDRNQFVVQPAFTLRRTSSRIADIRGPGITKFDLTISKKIAITERVSMKLQAEFYNAPNHPIFSNPTTAVTNANFTRITGTALAPRNIQLSGRISF
jgi:hypothetical protein